MIPLKILSKQEALSKVPTAAALAMSLIVNQRLKERQPLDYHMALISRAVEDAEGQLRAFVALYITYKADIEALKKGKIKEVELRGFNPADAHRQEVSLYIAELMTHKDEELYRVGYALIKDLDEFSRACDGMSFKHLSSVARTQQASRLLERAGFKMTGMVEGFPLYEAQREELPFLGKIIP